MLFPYKKFLIREGDRFDPMQFPSFEEDVSAINEAIAHLKSQRKADMIISFIKDKDIKKEWAGADPELAQLITSRSLPMQNIAALLDSCGDNRRFCDEVEVYLKTTLA